MTGSKGVFGGLFVFRVVSKGDIKVVIFLFFFVFVVASVAESKSRIDSEGALVDIENGRTAGLKGVRWVGAANKKKQKKKKKNSCK